MGIIHRHRELYLNRSEFDVNRCVLYHNICELCLDIWNYNSIEVNYIWTEVIFISAELNYTATDVYFTSTVVLFLKRFELYINSMNYISREAYYRKVYYTATDMCFIPKQMCIICRYNTLHYICVSYVVIIHFIIYQ